MDFIQEMQEEEDKQPRLSRLFTHEKSDITKLPTSNNFFHTTILKYCELGVLFRSKSASN